MAKNLISKISNAFSTGGGGVNFEQQIQAMFLLSLLIDGFCPAMNEQTKKVHFQAKHLGYDVDDLVVITYRNESEGKMLSTEICAGRSICTWKGIVLRSAIEDS